MSRDRDNDVTAPRWTQSLTARLAPLDRVDKVLGDIEEVHRDRIRRRGRFVATLCTSFDTLDVAIALSSDVRYTVRGLRAHPGFTTAVVATLALGIGVNAAIFPVVDRLLFGLPRVL